MLATAELATDFVTPVLLANSDLRLGEGGGGTNTAVLHWGVGQIPAII